MAAPCTSGTGTNKPGFALAQFVSPSAILAAINNVPTWQAVAIATGIGALSYDLSTFCPSGPPAMPTFTLGEMLALASFIPLPDLPSANAKLADFVGNLLWPQLCDCATGTYVAPTPPAVVTGTPKKNAPPVGSPGNGVQAPCAIKATHTSIVTGPLASGITVEGPVVWPSIGIVGGFFVYPTGLTVTGTVSAAGAGPHPSVSVYIEWRDVSNALLATEFLFTVASGAAASAFTTRKSPTNGGFSIITVNSSSTDNIQVHYDYYGDNCVPGGFLSPCCPPDPVSQSTLDAILQVVTLIQRQAAPFSYVVGTNHTALTGHGSFAVSGLIGVSVDVTTLPTSYGTRDGSPVELFDVGFVTLGTADGYEMSRRIDHDGALVLPPGAGVYTAVGYTLAPGVVVAIRELVREP